jgi:hypothetical protein
VEEHMKKIVCILICMLMCAAVVSVAGTVNINVDNKVVQGVTETSSSNRDIKWIQYNEEVTDTSMPKDVVWIHYDDGTCENSLGLTAGGVLHEAIKLTPTELSGYDGYAFTTVKVMHGCPLYPGSPSMPYTVWMYTGTTGPTDPMTQGTIVATGTCPAIDDYIIVNFTAPYEFAVTDTVWIGVAWTHGAGTFPCGFDTSINIPGKGGWLWYSGGGWLELGNIGYPGTWNLWGGVQIANPPPSTPSAPTGPDQGLIGTDYTFSAVTTDPDGEQVSYMFDWGDGTMSDWIGPFDSGTPGSAVHHWAVAGTFDVKAKAKDIAGGQSGWSPAHQITIVAGPSLEIGNITGGLLKVKAVIRNTGIVDATHVQWSITLTGGAFIGKDTNGTILSIPAGGEQTVTSKLILGFGKTSIYVSASCTDSAAAKQQNGTILLFFILTKG